MLILTRKDGETIAIGDVPVHRQEVAERIREAAEG